MIYLRSPSPWFDANRKIQRKLMQKHLSAMKNYETLDAFFNQRVDDIGLCYCLGTLSHAKLREVMISGVSSKKAQDVIILWDAQLLEAMPRTHLKTLQHASQCVKLTC